MSEEKAGSSKPIDPLEMFRGMRDTYLDSMAKAMVETVNSEAYAQVTGAMLNNSLAIAAPYREAMEKSMLQALQQLELPSRPEIVALAERFTNVEVRLDDMDAQLDPSEMFRRMRDAYRDSAAKAMIEVVNSEGYAQATGVILNNSLFPFREAMEKSMQQALEQLSLPSRQDIVALAGRFTTLETRLDDMVARLDRIENQTPAEGLAGPAAVPAESATATQTTEPEMPATAEEPVAEATAEESAATNAEEDVKQAPTRKRAARKATR